MKLSKADKEEIRKQMSADLLEEVKSLQAMETIVKGRLRYLHKIFMNLDRMKARVEDDKETVRFEFSESMKQELESMMEQIRSAVLREHSERVASFVEQLVLSVGKIRDFESFCAEMAFDAAVEEYSTDDVPSDEVH